MGHANRCDHCLDKKTGVALVRWVVSSAVQLLYPCSYSSYVNNKEMGQRKYVDVSCPAIVEEYNEHMGGADLFDTLMSQDLS